MIEGVVTGQKTQIGTPADLAATREARGMSLIDISQRIKLQVRQVRALEEGQWDALPGRSFVRAALRSYGKLLEVDVAPLLETIGGFAEPSEVSPMQPLGTSSSRSSGLGPGGGRRGRPMVSVIAGLVGVAAVVVYFGSVEDASRIRSWLPDAARSASSGADTTPPVAPPPTVRELPGSSTDAGQTLSAGPAATLADGAAQRMRSSADEKMSGDGTGSGSAGAIPPAVTLPGVEPPAGGLPGAALSGSGSPGAGSPGAGSPPVTASAAPSIPADGAPAAPIGAPPATAPSEGSAAPAQAPATRSATEATAAGPAAAAAGASTAALAPQVGSAADAEASAAAAGGVMQLKANQDAWVEVRNADGSVLHNRLVKAGSSVELKGTPPYRLVLGNASNLELSYEGKARDLKPHIQGNNIARLQLR